MVNGFWRKRTLKRRCLSIDLKKVFDTVKWEIIDNSHNTLKAYDFSPLFCRIIWNCISSASSVMLEGTLQEPQRNQTRGSPLFPILFNILMDTLSRLIEREVRNKRKDTYQVNRAASIIYLMYADDIFIFTKAYQQFNSPPLQFTR